MTREEKLEDALSWVMEHIVDYVTEEDADKWDKCVALLPKDKRKWYDEDER